MKKTRVVAGISAPVAIFSAALFASEKLYDFAFKRVDYVPETSADKQNTPMPTTLMSIGYTDSPFNSGN